MIRPTARRALALLLPLALVMTACGDDDDAAEGGGGGGGDTGAELASSLGDLVEEAPSSCGEVTAPDGAPEVVLGAQGFEESEILAELYRGCLEAAGYDVSVQELGGFRDLVLASFEGGDINATGEYAASMLEQLNADATEATGDAAETTGLLQGYLTDLGLVALEPSAAVNTNSFVVTGETADELGLETLSDLADHPDLTIGAPADCQTNAFCLPGLERVYGVDLSDGFTALEPGAIADALDAGEIDVALLFSTSGVIAANDWVLLEDDQQMLAADNIVPVVTTELSEVDGLVELFDLVSGTLTTEALTEANRAYNIDRLDADVIAGIYLEAAGLVTA